VGDPEEKEKGAPQEGRPTQPFWREKIILLVFLTILVSDQVTKVMVVKSFERPDDPNERVKVVNGFFDLVYRTNTGAAFSMFKDSNKALAGISIIAMGALIWFRRHFDNGTRRAKIALGLLMGGILGNVIDRLAYGWVVDFARIYIDRQTGRPLEWPAFNIADSAICLGVGLLFIIAWSEQKQSETEKEAGEN